MLKRLSISAVILMIAAFAIAAQLTFSVNDLLAVKRVGDPQLSPDGRTVAFTIGTVDIAANRVINQIYLINIDGTGLKQITSDKGSSSSPRWSPDGQRIAYVTGGQIWTMRPDGGDREQVTKLSTGAGGPVWSRDGKWIAFSSEVYPQCKDDACNQAEDERVEKSKVQAKVTERLLFKHWNEWRDRKRSHVFVVSSKGGTARDVTPGDFDSPPYAAATGVDYSFSPDGKYLAYLKNPDKVEALSTNSDIYLLDLANNVSTHVTQGMNGYDVSPTFTSDGKYMLFRSQATATFEADRWRIMRYDMASKEIVELTRGFDQQAEEMTVAPDNKTVYFTAGERGRQNIYSVPVEPDFRLRIATHVKRVTDSGFVSGVNVTPDGKGFVFLSSRADMPAELEKAAIDGSGRTSLTKINEASMQAFRLRKIEDVEWKGGLNASVHGLLLKPANFDPSRKYPLMVLIHGGPQGAWNDNWGYRWNPQIYAAQGYVVFMPNPRGSTGYGQRFVNEISGDWGGKAYTDIMNGVAEVIKQPFIDKTRIGGAGASYGGYMVNWILGHNNDPRFKFKALVSHAGVYNLESMATTTEELWFVNWEFKGMPWENPLMYERWSPHKFVKNFSTPTLVTAGELDYRVPVDQSLQLYTSLQVRGVKSKLVVFPDEGHWILKPQNSQFWYGQVLDWFKANL